MASWLLSLALHPVIPWVRLILRFYGGAEDYHSHEYEGILDLRDNKKPVRDKSGVYSATLYAKVLTDLPDCRELITRSEQLHTRPM